MRLKGELAAELELPWGQIAVHEAKGSAPRVLTGDSVELRMVEGVKAFSAEFEGGPLAEGKGFVDGSVEVAVAGADHCILAGVAEAQIRTAVPRCDRRREAGVAHVLIAGSRPGLYVLGLTTQIGTDRITPAQADGIPIGILGSVTAEPRQTGFGDDVACDLPTAQK